MSQPSNEMTSEEAIAIVFDAVRETLRYMWRVGDDEAMSKAMQIYRQLAGAEMVLRKATRTQEGTR